MYFKKTIVLVALAAATAAPSALAMRTPDPPYAPGQVMLTWQAGLQPKGSPHGPCGGRMLQAEKRCILRSV
jgi:hypothetical protein